MAFRLAARLPRLVVLGAILLFASATLTWGAATQLSSTPPLKTTPVVKATVMVPDVTGQAFVFAKGTLEDGGFAWQVTGSVHGYSANAVASQTPPPGTRLVDTGAPVVNVKLTRGRYPEVGQPEDVSPYLGTAVLLARVRAAAAPIAPAAARGAKQKPAPAKTTAPANRAPAFTVSGAPSEPLDEVTLTVRAHRLDAWLRAHREPTSANVNHFLYQHAWIVTGAKFGWSHGAEALRVLIAVDRRASALWGIGVKSERLARRTLAEVQARSR